MHPCLISLLPSHSAALQSAGSQLCLSGPACCGAKPRHVLQHTSPSILPLVRICTYVRVLSFCPSVQCRLMQISYCCLTVDEFVFMGERVLDAPWFLIYGTGRHWVLQGQLQLHRNREVQDLFSVGWSTCLHIMVIIFWSVSLLQKMYFEEHEQRYRSRK